MGLRELRESLGMTQKDLGERCGVKPATISAIEVGKNKPRVKLAKKLGDIFGVDWLIFYED